MSFHNSFIHSYWLYDFFFLFNLWSTFVMYELEKGNVITKVPGSELFQL